MPSTSVLVPEQELSALKEEVKRLRQQTREREEKETKTLPPPPANIGGALSTVATDEINAEVVGKEENKEMECVIQPDSDDEEKQWLEENIGFLPSKTAKLKALNFLERIATEPLLSLERSNLYHDGKKIGHISLVLNRLFGGKKSLANIKCLHKFVDSKQKPPNKKKSRANKAPKRPSKTSKNIPAVNEKVFL